MMKKKDSNLLNPEQAVENYLDMLLQEASEVQEKSKPMAVKNNVVLLPDLEIPDIEPEEQVAPVASVEKEIKHEAFVEPEEKRALPEDRRQDFSYPIQCLMFKVSGTQLSIPLIEMGSVLPWVDKMTKIPSSQSWSLGVLQHRDRNIRVVDTARLLNINKKTETGHPGHILVFGDSDWALSCDFLGEVAYVESDDIQWSGPKSKGLSMGTIKGTLAQLLDPVKIISHLESISLAD